nr:small hydrophobic protein [Bat paramyxovirus]
MSAINRESSNSDIYMNETHEWTVPSNYPDVTLRNNQRTNMNGTIEYVKNLIRIKKLVGQVKTSVSVIIFIICFSLLVLTSLAVMFGITTKHACIDAIAAEDQEIKSFLKKLYKDCKDNPLNFDWTAQIFRRIEEAEDKIYSKLIAYEIPSTLDNLVGAISEYCDGTPTAAKFYLTIDRGKGIHFAGNSKLLQLEPDVDIHEGDDEYHKAKKRKRRPKPKPTSRWYRPTGMPGAS